MSLETLLVIMTFASYRLARLLTEDGFPPVKWLREKFTAPYEELTRRPTKVPYWLAYLWTCMWCMPVWTSGFITLGVWLVMGLPAPLLVWFAVSAGASLISHLEEYFVR